MAIILVSILTTFVVIPVLLFVGIIFFCYAIFAYVMFCKGLKRFLLRDNIPSRWYWFPLYNLYLMGRVVQYEVGYQSWLLENAKYILPVGWTILQFINGKWIIFFSAAYLFYKVYCYYQFGNYTMYAGTRIPPAEPHRLACGFSQTGMRRTVRKLALEDKLATADEIAVMTDAEVCNLIVGKYTVVYSESEEVGLVETDRLEKYKNLVKIISR